MSTPGSITNWLQLLALGDRDAVDPLWERYFPRLVSVARRRLANAPRRLADEEDVALSALDSFVRAAREGRFPRLNDRHDLWSVLVCLVVRKAVDLIRHELRRCRKTSAVPLSEVGELIGRTPSPIQSAQLDELLGQLLERLDRTGDPDLRTIAIAKLEGYSIEEIAERIGCVRRTIERKLRFVADVWRQEGSR